MKTLLALRHKGLEFSHIWVSYPDIAALLESKGVKPNSDGTPYTLPALDTNDVGVIMGSMKIAKYLETTYPDSDSLFPHLSLPLAELLEDLLHQISLTVYPIMFPGCVKLLDERGAEYFRRTREARLGPLEAIWQDKEKQDKIRSDTPVLLRKVAKLLEIYEGPFVLGKERCYADILLVTRLEYMRLCNEDFYHFVLSTEPVLKQLYEACADIL